MTLLYDTNILGAAKGFCFMPVKQPIYRNLDRTHSFFRLKIVLLIEDNRFYIRDDNSVVKALLY